MYDLEALFPDNIFLMMGLHPCYVKENYLEELAHVEAEFAKRKFSADDAYSYFRKTYNSSSIEDVHIYVKKGMNSTSSA
jgi:hypothetical protein